MASFFHAVPYFRVGRSDRENDVAEIAMEQYKMDRMAFFIDQDFSNLSCSINLSKIHHFCILAIMVILQSVSIVLPV